MKLLALLLFSIVPLIARAAEEHIVLWDPPENAEEAELIGYRLYLGSTKPEDLQDGSVVYAQVRDIPLAEYVAQTPEGESGIRQTFDTGAWSVYVTAYNVTGESLPSNTASFSVLPPVPGPPQNTRAKEINVSFNFDKNGSLEAIRVKDIVFHDAGQAVADLPHP